MTLAILQLGREVFNTEVVIYSFFMKHFWFRFNDVSMVIEKNKHGRVFEPEVGNYFLEIFTDLSLVTLKMKMNRRAICAKSSLSRIKPCQTFSCRFIDKFVNINSLRWLPVV